MHNPAMPENKINEEVENVVKDERFKEIVDDCIVDCFKNCEKCDYNKCLRRCLKAAWVLYHVWYIDSAATSPTA